MTERVLEPWFPRQIYDCEAYPARVLTRPLRIRALVLPIFELTLALAMWVALGSYSRTDDGVVAWQHAASFSQGSA